MRITTPSGDDWVVHYRLRRNGKTINRVLGISGGSTKEQALTTARWHINPLRARLNGTAWEILDETCVRMYEWRARRIAATGSQRIQQQVRSASRG